MTDYIKAFLSISSILGGVVLVLIQFSDANRDWGAAGAVTIGVLMIAGGLTYFWMRSRFNAK